MSFQKVRSLTGIHHDHALRMVDGPGVGGQPRGPIAISEDRQPPRQSVSASLDLRSLDADGAGLDGVQLHDVPLAIEHEG